MSERERERKKKQTLSAALKARLRLSTRLEGPSDAKLRTSVGTKRLMMAQKPRPSCHESPKSTMSTPAAPSDIERHHRISAIFPCSMGTPSAAADGPPIAVVSADMACTLSLGSVSVCVRSVRREKKKKKKFAEEKVTQNVLKKNEQKRTNEKNNNVKKSHTNINAKNATQRKQDCPNNSMFYYGKY